MEDDTIESCPEYAPQYKFCPDADWWKDGITYEDAAGQAEPDSQLTPLEVEFNERAERWEKETGMHSSPVIRFMHEDYQAIMAKGPKIIPLILERLRSNPDDWFWALKFLSGKDCASSAKGFDGAVAAWLRWGLEEGYISE